MRAYNTQCEIRRRDRPTVDGRGEGKVPGAEKDH